MPMAVLWNRKAPIEIYSKNGNNNKKTEKRNNDSLLLTYA